MAFLLKGLLQLLHPGFRCLFALRRFVIRLARQRDLLFELTRQRSRALAFLLKRLLQLLRPGFLRQNLWALLLLQGLSRLRRGRLHGLLELCMRLRCGLIGFGPLLKSNIARE